MREPLSLLAELGAWALPHLWLPVAVWTVAALAAEVLLRLRARTHPVVALGVRRAILWALPVGLIAAALLPLLLPAEATERIAVFSPEVLTLPTLVIGGGAPASPQAPAPLPLAPLAAGLALLVASLAAAVRVGALARGLWRLSRLTSGTAHDASVQREADFLARQAGVTRAVRTVTTATQTVPYTYGWRHPVVVVPAALTDDPARLRLVLAHEIAHVAQGDFASGVADRAAAALFAWHPLVAVLLRRIDLDRERATDAAVLASYPSGRRDYADLLLSFSRLPSPALTLGAARGSRSLTSRITTMQTPPLSTVRLRRLRSVAQLLALTLFLGAVALAAVVTVGPAQARTLVAPEASGDVAAEVSGEAAVRFAPEAPTPVSPPAAETPPAPLAPEAVVIRGTVADIMTNEPLVGANVVVVGTQKGAATDVDGAFVIEDVDAGDVELRVTFVGYRPVTLTPEAGQPVVVRMIPSDPEVIQRRMQEMRERLGQNG